MPLKVRGVKTVSALELQHGIHKEQMEKMIARDLAVSLGERLVEAGIQDTMISTGWHKGMPQPPGIHELLKYELDAYVMTKEEYEEYEALKKFRREMGYFVKGAEY